MNKITAIFNFKQRKTVGEAIILYCVSAGGLLGIVLLIGSILEIIFGVGYVFGFWFGVITSISASIFLSLRILSQRKLGFINNDTIDELIINFNIFFPEKLTEEQKENLEQLL